MALSVLSRARKISCLLAIGMVLLVQRPTSAQQIFVGGQQIFVGAPAEIELTAPQLDKISGPTQSRLEQARALAADRKWEEAVDTLRDLASAENDRLVAVNESTFLPLPTYCQLELSHWPADGLTTYRQRVDTTAEKWYRDGVAAHDAVQLNRVVDEAFCSSWGDQALMALGELALEHGDYTGARRAWQAISPLLRDPNGRPEWLALAGIDFSKHWSRVAARWPARPEPADWLAYPDTKLNLSDLRARLVLVSVREGDFDRAKIELEILRRFDPQAAGRLAGEEGPYVPPLERLLKSAQDWPTPAHDDNWPMFALCASRNAVAPMVGPVEFPAWRDAVSLPPFSRQWVQVTLGQTKATGEVAVREPERPSCAFPLIIDGRAYVNEARKIRAIDLASGQPAVTKSGVLYELEPEASEVSPSGLSAMGGNGGIVTSVPRYTMTYADGILYARMGEDTNGAGQAGQERRDERLVGLDLRRDGLLAFEVKPDDASWSFEGAPVVDGGRVYVAMRHTDVKPQQYVAAFDAATGRRLWRTSIVAADTPASGSGDEITHNLLTVMGDRLFINTNLGAVAALATDNGQIAWLRRYDRIAGKLREPLPVCFDRDPSPCVYDRGMIYVSPADSPSVFALDAETGAALWSSDELGDIINLLGVAGGNLIASGNRLAAVDATTGQVRFIWPESSTAGIRGFGRGVVAGNQIYWPTRDKIYVVDAITGQQRRKPIDIAQLTTSGGNLIASNGCLLLATPDKLMALGSLKLPPTKPEAAPKAPGVAAAP
jgi:outer membrane protein assembly factor BamB